MARGAGHGLSAEKKSLHAEERDTKENRRRRAVFVAELASLAPEQLMYLEESGVSTQMSRLWGRCRGGRRLHDAAPGGHWKMLTVLGALSTQGMLAAMTVEAATDREVFLAFLEQVLCPKLRPGDTVVMNTLSAHKVAGVRELIERAGARLLSLPPYSPDLNPIEKAWSKLKPYSAKPRPAARTPCTKPSPNSCQLSARKTPKPGSDFPFSLYSYEGNPLVSCPRNRQA